MDWQPIETAPDERIALMTDGDRVTVGKKLDWGNGEVEFIDYTVPEHIIRPYHPTHWMPLPEPPAIAMETGTATAPQSDVVAKP